MKKIRYLLLSLFLSSCTLTNQQKAEKLVTKYLDSALNDPHSYESLNFSTVKKHFERKSDAKSIMNGWEISHTYRAKNGFGALGIHTTVFEIDSSMNKVLYGDEAN